MTGPDRIWVNWKPADDEHPPSVVGAATVYSRISTMAYPVEYIRRDPAVLAALPEVQALIAAAYEVAAGVLDAECDLARIALPQAVPVLRADARDIRALTPAAAAAALAARDAAMRAQGLREAAEWYRVAGWKLDEDDVPDAILARAAEIERDGK